VIERRAVHLEDAATDREYTWIESIDRRVFLSSTAACAD
jgi:hypothetical protein